MHQTRRRKKRPSYGVRTIEIVRGRNGFGFTISGQAPCILSCIVNGSPAEKAGLRPGDYLIAVNGQNVSKAPHDDVVRMIGSCQGLLKLQIAENYYSNSSDDEITPTTRPRPKYPHRFRQRQQQNHHNGNSNNSSNQQNHQCPHSNTTTPFYDICPSPSVQPKIIQRSDNHDYKNISDVHMQPWKGGLQQDAVPQSWIGNSHTVHCKHSELGGSSLTAPIGHWQKQAQLRGAGSEKKPQQMARRMPTPSSWTVTEKENQQPIFTEHEINSIVYPSLQQLQCNSDTEESIYKAVVGYLGTIEMPKEPQLPGHRLSAIRNCIRRLRVEKKVHTLVLLKVFSDKITLTNSHGATMAEYLTERITFCGAYADDKKFFGLVTTRAEVVEVGNEEGVVNSSSCHVFMVDPKLLQHEEHLKRAKSFRINCVPDMGSGRGECCEFPESVDPILVAIVGLYRGRGGMPMDLNANVSPQPSNTSSNSDSGIGFRDEGQNSDRVSIVDLDNDYGYLFPLPHPQRVGPEPASWKSCPVHAQQRHYFNGTAPPNKKDPGPPSNPQVSGSKLTVRAMPDPVGFINPDTSYNTELLNNQQEAPNIRKSVQKYLQRTMGHNCGHSAVLMPQGHGGALSSVIRSVSPVLISTRPESPDAVLLRLSPKVYDTTEKCQIIGELDGEYQDSDGVPTLPDDNTENTCEQEGSQDVHPPTQEEDTETSSQDIDVDLPDEGKRWSRSSSFRKQLKSRFGNSKGQEGATFSDGELVNGKVSNSDSMVGFGDGTDMSNGCQGNMTADVGRVGSWAVSFEKLLADPAGMHTFAEFLKKEFSYENIAFWVTCEQYRKLTDENQMKPLAKEIFRRYIALGSAEPVNVDSHARQMVEEKLDCPTSDIFKLPQKQIFDLMKFDCYTRFLKASFYQECMLKEVSGETLPYLGDDNLDPNLSVSGKPQNDKKSKDGSDDRRRKSLLPWNRTKSGKTKKEKCSMKKGEKRDEICSLSMSDLTDSRSSLTSSALEIHSGDATQDPASFCRVVFPDQSSTVVSAKPGESIASCLTKVLQRRGLSYSAFDLYWTATSKIVEQDKDCNILCGQEVRIEERTLLQIELPTKKTITLKAKPSLPLTEVLRPVLHKYNYQMDQVSVYVSGNEGNVDVNESPAALITNCVIIQLKNKDHGLKPHIHSKQKSLNELTSKLIGGGHFPSESLDTQDNNRSSFRDSHGFLKLNNCSGKPPIAARPSLPKNESDEMYDLWKRAQRSRLDDQRGTEINFELPEFLKTQPNDILTQHFQDGRASEPNPVCRSKVERTVMGNRLSRLNSEVFPAGRSRLNECDDSLLKDGVLPTHKQAEEYFSACQLGFVDFRPDEHRNFRDLGLFLPSKRLESSHTVIARPCSHPPPSIPTWCRSTSVPSSTDILKAERTAGSSLICADSSFMERSFSPSTVPPPADTSGTSIHGDMANYLPPSPVCVSSEKCPPQIPQRLPSDPPPLPPKPRPHRRPVPPAPGHLTHLTFCNNSDEDKCALNRQYGVMDINGSRLHSAISEPCHNDKCSVSFV